MGRQLLKQVKDVPACEGCPFRRLFPENNFVKPLIRSSSTRLMVAEAPGETEALEGEPLVGGSGSILRGTRIKDARTGEIRRYGGLLAQAGVREETVSYVNTIQCRPPNNVYPTDAKARSYITKEDGEKVVAHCLRNHVLPVLQNRAWGRVDLLGDKALRLLGGKREGITAWRGSPINLTVAGCEHLKAVPTIHPAALMRSQNLFPAVVNDLKKSIKEPPEYYNLHPTLEEVQAFNAETFAFDIETDWPRTSAITMVGLCAEPYKALVVPFRGAYKRELQRIFAAARVLVGQNCISFDIPYLQKNDITFDEETLNNNVYDIMLMQHLVQPDMPHDLTFIGSIFTSKPTWEFNKHGDMELYNARDVDVTMQAFKQLLPLLKMEGLLDLYCFVQVPLARICKLMHDTGIAVEPERIERVRDKLLKEMVELEKNLPENLRTQLVPIRKRIPAPEGTMTPLRYGKKGQLLKQKPVKFLFEEGTKKIVPWRSPEVLGEWLYEENKIPEEHDLKSGNRTTGKIAAAKILRRLQNGTYKISNAQEVHSAFTAIQRLKQLDELETTFVSGTMAGISRVFPHFNVHGTNSGRLSGSDPNPQNIPPTARALYVPSYEGWKLIEVDFSGIENRLTALFANDTDRLHRFDSIPGFSEHKWATELFFGIPYDEVIKDNSREAPYGRSKAIVHGTNYGEGARKIALLNDIPESEVRKLLIKWKEAIPATIAWQEATGKQAAKDGYLTTPFGRKRWFWGSSMFTESLSFLPQSAAADIIFRAMIGLMYERIGWSVESVQRVCDLYIPLPEPARLLLQVHDALVFECPNDSVAQTIEIIRTVMEQPFRQFGNYKFPVEISVGPSWGECEKYESV